MKIHNIIARTSIILVLALLIALSGCGRIGPAQPPSTSSAITASSSINPSASSSTIPSASSSQNASSPQPDNTPTISPSSVTTQTPAGVNIQISKITVTFYGNAATSKGFTWYTNQKSSHSDIEIIEKTGVPDFSSALIYSGTASVPRNSPNELMHKAEATELKSGTAYYYRVGDASLNAWSNVAFFTTAPVNGSFTFVDVSDTQMADKKGADLTAGIVQDAFGIFPQAGFLINNGDIVDSSSETQWNWLLGSFQPILQNTTIMPASGNHDSGKDYFFDHFNLDTPTTNTSTGAYYSVDYGNAHFVVLNTNESSSQYAEFSDAQIAWLEKDISSAKASGAKWVIVVMHKGPFSTATHVDDSDVVDTRKKVAPIFSQLGVDLVLQGHDHVYSRSKPIAQGGSVSEIIQTIPDSSGNQVSYMFNPKGTVYITPGTAGVKHYSQKSSLPQAYLTLFDYAKGPFSGDPKLNSLETFVGFTIDNNKLTAYAYQVDKSDKSAKPVLVDRFGIVKN